MVGNRLTQRVAELERTHGPDMIERYEWMVACDGETAEEAEARYTRENGPLPPRVGLLIWRPVQPGEARPCA